jgi:hypothetical protein
LLTLYMIFIQEIFLKIFFKLVNLKEEVEICLVLFNNSN